MSGYSSTGETCLPRSTAIGGFFARAAVWIPALVLGVGGVAKLIAGTRVLVNETRPASSMFAVVFGPDWQVSFGILQVSLATIYLSSSRNLFVWLWTAILLLVAVLLDCVYVVLGSASCGCLGDFETSPVLSMIIAIFGLLSVVARWQTVQFTRSMAVRVAAASSLIVLVGVIHLVGQLSPQLFPRLRHTEKNVVSIQRVVFLGPLGTGFQPFVVAVRNESKAPLRIVGYRRAQIAGIPGTLPIEIPPDSQIQIPAILDCGGQVGIGAARGEFYIESQGVWSVSYWVLFYVKKA